MLPLRPHIERERQGRPRPTERPTTKFKLPYPPGKQPPLRIPDPDFDPFEYVPELYHPPKISQVLSDATPRSTRYEILDRVTGPDGLPNYILRAVAEGEEAVKLEKRPEQVNGDAKEEADETDEDETGEGLTPAEFIRAGLLKKPRKVLPWPTRSSTPLSNNMRVQTPGASNEYDMDVVQISYTKILSYVSPLQLERFEHYRFQNPTADDLPWLASTGSVSSSSRSVRLEEREKKLKGRPPKKKLRLEVFRTEIDSLRGTPASSNADEDEEDRTVTLPQVNGDQELAANIASALSKRRGYAMVEHRPRSIGTLRESTIASSSRATPSLPASTPQEGDPLKRRRRRTRDSHNPKPKSKSKGKGKAKAFKVEGDDEVYEVKRILTHDYADNLKYYQVSWVGYLEEEPHLSWLTEAQLQGAPKVLRRYQRELGMNVPDSDEDSDEEDEDRAASNEALAEEGIV